MDSVPPRHPTHPGVGGRGSGFGILRRGAFVMSVLLKPESRIPYSLIQQELRTLRSKPIQGLVPLTPQFR